MKCPKCHAENPDDAEYCSLCYASFKDGVKSSRPDKAEREILEKNKGSLLCCPSCGEMSPLEAQFCLRCGYVFEDKDSILVDKEEIARIRREKEEAKKKELEVLLYAPITVTAESDGAEVMRSIEEILNKGYHARIHTHGRNATTYAMKIIALMGEDLYKKGKEVVFMANLISEGSVVDLEQVELEIILETKQED
jgi:ribosomal protein L40E